MAEFVPFTLGGGLNTKADESEIADNQMARVSGCRGDRVGAISSERTRTKLNTTALPGGGKPQKIKGSGEYTNSGTVKRITKCGEKVYEDLATEIGTFAGTGDISVESYNGYAYIADGNQFRRWDGSSLEEVGLDKPNVSGISTVTSNAGSLLAGAYKFVITSYNGVAESNFSATLTIAALAADKQIEISGIPALSGAVTEHRIYRTLANGTAFFYDGSTTGTTYTIGGSAILPEGADAELEADQSTPSEDADILDQKRNITTLSQHRKPARVTGNATLEAKFDEDRTGAPVATGTSPEIVYTNLGALADWTDHDVPPNNVKHLVSLNEQLFAIRNNKVRFTLPSQPEHWPVLNSFTPGRNTGDQLMSILPMRKTALACYTDSGVYVFTQTGIAPTDARLDDVESPVGLAGEWAVAALSSGVHVFLAHNGIYVFDGRQVLEIGYAVEELFTDSDHEDYINPDLMDDVLMVGHRDKVYMSYGKTSDGDRLMTIDFQDPANPQFYTSKTEYRMLAVEKSANRLIGGDTDGFVYELNTGGDDNTVQWQPESKKYPISTTNEVKAIEEVVLDVDLGGVETTITVSADHEGTTRTTTFTDSSSGRQRIKKRLPHTMKGSTVKVRLASNGAADRHWYGGGFLVEPGGMP